MTQIVMCGALQVNVQKIQRIPNQTGESFSNHVLFDMRCRVELFVWGEGGTKHPDFRIFHESRDAKITRSSQRDSLTAHVQLSTPFVVDVDLFQKRKGIHKQFLRTRIVFNNLQDQIEFYLWLLQGSRISYLTSYVELEGGSCNIMKGCSFTAECLLEVHHQSHFGIPPGVLAGIEEELVEACIILDLTWGVGKNEPIDDTVRSGSQEASGSRPRDDNAHLGDTWIVTTGTCEQSIQERHSEKLQGGPQNEHEKGSPAAISLRNHLPCTSEDSSGNQEQVLSRLKRSAAPSSGSHESVTHPDETEDQNMTQNALLSPKVTKELSTSEDALVASREKERHTAAKETPPSLLNHAALPDARKLTGVRMPMPMPTTRRLRKVPAVPPGIKLYRTKTKRPLIEGEEISDSDEEPDEPWIKLLHNRQLDRYKHLWNGPELEFVKAFDEHMRRERPGAFYYVGDSLKRFALARGAWLLEDGGRRMAFAKELVGLNVRGVIDVVVVAECNTIVNAFISEDIPRK